MGRPAGFRPPSSIAIDKKIEELVTAGWYIDDVGQEVGLSASAVFNRMQRLGIRSTKRGRRPRGANNAIKATAKPLKSEPPLPIARSSFIKPLTKEQLMVGR